MRNCIMRQIEKLKNITGKGLGKSHTLFFSLKKLHRHVDEGTEIKTFFTQLQALSKKENILQKSQL